MEFKEKLLASHLAFEGSIDLSDSVHQIRLESLKTFEQMGFPSRKDEAWKYTSLNSMLRNDFALFPETETTIEIK